MDQESGPKVRLANGEKMSVVQRMRIIVAICAFSGVVISLPPSGSVPDSGAGRHVSVSASAALVAPAGDVTWGG